MAPAAWARIKKTLRRKFPVFTRKISHINRLPPELLGIIFLHLIPEPDILDLRGIPNLLGQVCRFWRALTLTLPALWASLSIICTPSLLHPQLHTIHTYLLRSATHPLSIILLSHDLYAYDAPLNPYFLEVITVLVAARNRWRHILVTVSSNELMQETLDAITQGDTPLLQSFHYSINGVVFQRMPPIPLHTLQRCPQLESMSWGISGAPISLELGGNTWPHLTTLLLNGHFTVSDCLVLLRLSPCLSSVHFGGINSPSDATSHHLHATLDTLSARGPHTAMFLTALT